MDEQGEKGLQEPPEKEGTSASTLEGGQEATTENAMESVAQALQGEIAQLQEELNRFRELYLRKLADFENFRKRKEKEAEDFRQAAHTDLVRDVLPVVDNLERALAVPEGDGSGIRSGVELVLRQLKDVLSRYGLAEINPLGQPFDPRYHEAVARQERADLPGDQVVEVLQKGYTFKGKLLRPALVVVGVATRSRDSQEEQTGETGEEQESRGDPWVP